MRKNRLHPYAAAVLATTALTWAAVLARPQIRIAPRHERWTDAWKAVLQNRPALWLLGADAFWNASVDGIRPYFFLYARRVLGTSVSQTSFGLVLLEGLARGYPVVACAVGVDSATGIDTPSVITARTSMSAM